MILWRTKSNDCDVASTRYRTVYPAWFLAELLGVDSRFVSGRSTARMVRQAGPGSAIVFSKHFSRDDYALARKARARGLRIVYDQCDNFFAKNFSSSVDNPDLVRRGLPLIDALVFPTAALRAAFVENGFPPDKCHVVPDPMISGPDEIAALAWARRRTRRYRRLPFMPAERGWRGPPPQLGEAALPRKTAERLVWFGAVGSRHGRAGVDLIADLVPALNAVAAVRPIELLLVTSRRPPCEEAMAGARFAWHFVPWTVSACIEAVRSAEACLLPAGDDAFSQTKSANRVLMAAANGVPAVSTPHPSITGCEDAFFIARDASDWAAAIASALDARADRHAAGEREKRLAPLFGGEAVARAWAQILLPASGPAGHGHASHIGLIDRAGPGY